MLEAAQRGPRFTISLKRSTQNSSAINKLPADYPIFVPGGDIRHSQQNSPLFDHLVGAGSDRERASPALAEGCKGDLKSGVRAQ